jgi:hypothetical protein
MTRGCWRLPVLLVSAPLVVGACSSSSAGSHPPSHSASTPSAQVQASSAAPSSTGSGTSAVQTYLSAVNRLCDALLPKVIAVTHGGSLDVPVKKYLAQQPEHAKLLAGFDRKLARIPVPPAAKKKAAAFAAYVRLANRLDAKRLAAAKRGEAAYAREIKSEASVESDPAVTGLGAAGFGQSCQAR